MSDLKKEKFEGLVIIDKPSGPTSHGVVGRTRKILNTRKVGHAGTLDPMATGMLVLGVGRATRLLGFLTASEKEYVATIRFGISTNTDDAEGDIVDQKPAAHLSEASILEAMRDFRGHISQRPSAVSAIKVDGQRAYTRVRNGEEVELAAREVTIHDLEVVSITSVPEFDVTDVVVRVVCSAGTYIRALARDLGSQLNVGGHLTSLRRTRSGVFTSMRSLDELEASPSVIPLTESVRMAFPIVTLNESDSVKARHGVRVPAPVDSPSGVAGIFDSTGEVISISRIESNEIHPLVVFAHE